MSHQQDYDRIMEAFSQLPTLDFSKVMSTTRGTAFVMPKITLPKGRRDIHSIDPNSNTMSNSSGSNRKVYPLLDSLPPSQPSGIITITVLLDAIEKASGKLEYGRTPLREWNRRLVFAGDEAILHTSHPWDIRRNNGQRWTAGHPINESSGSTDDWFRGELVAGIQAGRFSQGLVVHGAAGSGKSTLLKYLILKNYAWLRDQRVVFSRFELMKFWNKISHDPEGQFTAQAKKYMAVILARDLLLHRFTTWSEDQGCFNVDMSPAGSYPPVPVRNGSTKTRFNAELDLFLGECRDECSYYGIHAIEQVIGRIREVVSGLGDPSKKLTDNLGRLKLSALHIMIFVLAREKKIVVVYDGLDAVRPEDVLSETKDGTALWECAQKVMQQRDVLGSFSDVIPEAPELVRQSILVTRNNTLQGLVYLNATWADSVAALPKFQIASVAMLPAAISTARTVISYIPEFHERSQADRNRLATLLLRPYERSMAQILQDLQDDESGDRMEDLFDGNLRKLFRLLSLSLRWTSREMLQGGFLDPAEYQTSAELLLQTLASDRGVDFLRHKSYRTVETLLVGRAAWFENAVIYREYQIPPGNETRVKIETNDAHHGVIDNILNYAPAAPAKTMDEHMQIEKVRYLQILKTPMTLDDLRSVLSGQFGYSAGDRSTVWTKVLFLMKTGFLTVDVAERDGGQFMIATSNRGRLALKLLGNLSYIENIFHQTRFPEPLVAHINDQVRSTSTLNWSAQSIRNAFVFLCYFKCLESNPMSGQGVPSRYRLFDEIYSGLIRSIEAMTKPGRDDDDKLRHNRADITKLAIEEIDRTRVAWQKRLIG
jgi:hypothetical protein